MHHGPHSPLIHTLDNDSLLEVFSLYRPLILDESEADNNQFLDGGEWSRERWWFTLAHVCRRWRHLVFESASHLRLSLVCARGTPVADMLAHSPPLPLIIDHLDQHNDITEADEEGITLALQYRDRVRRIRLMKSVPVIQKLITALDGEFPILEYLSIIHQRYRRPSIEHNVRLNLPETFRAPHLRHLVLMSFNHSNRISVTSDYGEPRHSVAQLDPTFRIFPPECFTPAAFTHASARDTRDPF